MNFAERFTAAMATWTFIFAFLSLCVIEIVWNHTPAVVIHHWNFDPSTIILNLLLSLWAAVQGSIVMISQKRQEKRLMKMIEAILHLSEHADKRDEDTEKLLESMLVLHEGTQHMVEQMPGMVRKIMRDELINVARGIVERRK